MRWYISYPVLGAGLFFALDTFFPGAPEVAAPQVAILQDAAAEDSGPIVLSASEIADQPALRVARFSPGAVLLDAELPSAPSTSVLGYLAEAILPGRSEADDEIVPTAPVAVAEWRSAIVREQTPADMRAAAAEKVTARTRAALARDIQSELQRLGCYSGRIDGVWGGGSRRAIVAFMDRVNATLPTQEPDVFILSLVRSHASGICSTTPETIIADSGSRFEPTMARGASDRPPLPYGRMGIGGPRPDGEALNGTRVTGLTGGAAPRQPDGLARTAALESGDTGTMIPSELPTTEAAPSSFDDDTAGDVRPRKTSGSRAKNRPAKRSSSARHVQRLFTHPLGRM